MKMDKKFYGVIRKVKNETIVPDDEYVVFLVKDTAFARILPKYLEECIALGADIEQIKMVSELLIRVTTWRNEHPDRLKTPDANGEKVLD